MQTAKDPAETKQRDRNLRTRIGNTPSIRPKPQIRIQRNSPRMPSPNRRIHHSTISHDSAHSSQTNSPPQPHPPKPRISTNRLKQANPINIIQPNQTTGNEITIRRLNHPVQIGTIGPSSHHVAIMRFSKRSTTPSRMMHSAQTIQIPITYRPSREPFR